MTNRGVQTIEEIKNLKRKCALQQHCHFELASRIEVNSKVLNVSLVLLSGLTMLSTTAHADIIFSDVIDVITQRRLAAILSAAVFLLMLLRLELRLSEISSGFTAGGDAHTRFLRKIDMLIPTLDSLPVEEIERLGVQLTDEYVSITAFARTIPGRDFLRLKQRHLQRKAMSKALDADPYSSLDKT